MHRAVIYQTQRGLCWMGSLYFTWTFLCSRHCFPVGVCYWHYI